VVLVLVSPILRHSLLLHPLEAKIILVAISPTIATMKPYGLKLRLGMGLFIWFLSSFGFSPSFPKNTFPKVLLNLIGFWK
jgi:hypothetical protein